MVGAAHDAAHLFLVGHPAHDGKDLPGEHHPHTGGEEPFHPLAVVVVVAVEPALLAAVNPFLAAQMAGEPVRPLFQVVGQVGQFHLDALPADVVQAAVQVAVQQVVLGRYAVVYFRCGIQQRGDLCQQFGTAARFPGIQQPQQRGQFPQIARVGTGEGHTLAPVGGHVQGVVPVGAPQAVEVVLAHVVEGG